MHSDSSDLAAPVKVILGDGFCDFQRALLGGTPVVVDSMGRTYTAANLADYVALMQGLARETEAAALGGDGAAVRLLPGVWDALARGETAAALLADVPRPARAHSVTVTATGPHTVCRCACGQTLTTDATPASRLWVGLVRGFVGAHGGGQ